MAPPDHVVSGAPDRRILLYSHDTFGLGHLRRSRTIASALTAADPAASALIVTGSPIAGRFDFPEGIDHVRLPGVVKMSDGSYRSSNLRLDIDAMARLRGQIIAATDAEYRPDLLIVDKEAWGFRHELSDTLLAARARGARIVLGIRDVLDDEDALIAEWERKGAIDAIERFYDEVWVYGIPEICRPLAGLGLSQRMENRVVYTGYLRRAATDGAAPGEPDLLERPYILVTTGGGGDGDGLVDWVVSAYEAHPTLSPRALVVYGPFMNATRRSEFDSRIARLGGRVVATGFHGHLETVLERAAGVVAMGGYNTFCEILSMDRPAVIAPRTQPRREQLIRASSAERLGLVQMLHPERDGKTPAVMARAIEALADQPRPSEVRLPGLLSGLDRIAERAVAAPDLVPAYGS
ncbi:MAG: hypothetical protein AAFU49_07225 [Pseudomonadota bacterium]